MLKNGVSVSKTLIRMYILVVYLKFNEARCLKSNEILFCLVWGSKALAGISVLLGDPREAKILHRNSWAKKCEMVTSASLSSSLFSINKSKVSETQMTHGKIFLIWALYLQLHYVKKIVLF